MLAAHWPPAAFSSLVAFRPGFELTTEPLAFTLAAAAAAACAIGLRALSRSPFAAAGAWAVAAAAAWTVFFTLWLPYEEYGSSYRGLVAALKSRLPRPVGCIAYRDVGEPQRAMLEYFGDLVLRSASVAGEECEFLLVQQQRAERPPAQAGSILDLDRYPAGRQQRALLAAGFQSRWYCTRPIRKLMPGFGLRIPPLERC